MSVWHKKSVWLRFIQITIYILLLGCCTRFSCIMWCLWLVKILPSYWMNILTNAWGPCLQPKWTIIFPLSINPCFFLSCKGTFNLRFKKGKWKEIFFLLGGGLLWDILPGRMENPITKTVKTFPRPIRSFAVKENRIGSAG